MHSSSRAKRRTCRCPVTNEGDGTATGVSVRVTTGDPRPSVSPRTTAVGDLAAGETRTATFRLALAADYPLGKPVPLNVRTTFAGVLSPTYVDAADPDRAPAATPTTFAYAGPPVAIPDFSTTRRVGDDPRRRASATRTS